MALGGLSRRPPLVVGCPAPAVLCYTSMMNRIAVIGAGAWGTALALAARRAGRDVLLWARDPALAEAIGRTGRNQAYLPGIAIDPAIRATADAAALGQAE